MNRTDFLKAVCAETNTLTLKKPVGSATKAQEAFREGVVCGGNVLVEDRSEGSVKVARDALLSNARSFLPKGTKFYVLDGGEHRIWSVDQPKLVDVVAWLYSPSPLTPPRSYQVIAEVTA